MHFDAPYDTTTKVISTLVCLLLLSVGISTHSFIAGTLALAVLLVVYAYSPRGYDVSEGALIIRRLAGDVRLPLTELSEVRPTTKDDFRGCVRLMGSGGLFGYYGRFRTATLGQCSWYVTNRSRAVVAWFGAKTILLSPGDVPGFLQTVRTLAPPPSVAPRVPQGVRQSSTAGARIVVAIALVVAVLGAMAGFLAMRYAPGPPAYTLTHDTLTIHDRFYPVTLEANAVDIQQVRVVDLNQDEDWQPVRKTSGFNNAHYQSGWFRAANGRSMRMYRAGGSRLVLLPAKGDDPPVLLQTADPERFVEELRQEWQGHS